MTIRDCEECVVVFTEIDPAAKQFPFASQRMCPDRRCDRSSSVERPSSSSRHVFSPQMVETITEYLDDHSVQTASRRFPCSPKTVYNVLQRYGDTYRSRDGFSLREICACLRVKYDKVMNWIKSGRGAAPPDHCGGPTGYRLMLKRQRDGAVMSDPLLLEASIEMFAEACSGQPPSTWDLLRSTLDEGFRSIDRRLKECSPPQPERFNLKDADERLGALQRRGRFQL